MHLRFGIILAAAVVSRAAAADQASPRPALPSALTATPTPREPATEQIYYGWQNLIVDGASIGVLVAGLGGNRFAIAAGGAGVLFGSSAVHFAHGNPGRGVLSAGMRIGIPLATVAAFYAFSDPHNQCGCDGLGLLTAGLVTTGAFLLTDDLVLAWEERPANTIAARITPTVVRTREAWAFGLRTTF